MNNDLQEGIKLRFSAQRALWGNVPPSLRAVSLEIRGTTIHFRSVFATDVTDDHDLLSAAAGEVLADFMEPYMLEEECVTLDPPARPEHLRYLVFLRADRTAE